MKKKIVLIVAIFVRIIIIILFILFIRAYVIYTSFNPEPIRDNNFYKAERYETDYDSTIYFHKYYYYESSDKFYEKNSSYEVVENNVGIIKEYINTSLSKLHELDDTINIEFNYDSVTPNDYYYLLVEDFILLYYYDIDDHILYVTHYLK